MTSHTHARRAVHRRPSRPVAAVQTLADLSPDPRNANAGTAPGREALTASLNALGPDRVLCGDATDAGDVGRLLGEVVPVVMITDPPFGVDYDPAWRHRAFPRQHTAVGRVAHDTEAAWPAAFRLFPGDVIYAWH